MKRFAATAAVMTGALALVAPAEAALVGVSSATPGGAYSIDAATGAATLLSNLDTTFTSLVGATYLDGTLYASDLLKVASFFVGTVDPATGATSLVSNQDGSINWHSLASDEGAGLIYTVDLDDGSVLKSMTAAGVTASIGTGVGFSAIGLAYDDLNDILYATSSDDLYTIDTMTGVATLIGSLGFSDGQLGLAYDEMAQVLYANTGNLQTLFALNVATGLGTAVGVNGVSGIDGLAWIADAAVPLPAALPLFLLGAAGLGFSRKRRKITS